MPLRCTTPNCGGNLFLERAEDSGWFGAAVPTSEYVCSLCSARSSPPVPLPSAAEYQQAQYVGARLDSGPFVSRRKARAS